MEIKAKVTRRYKDLQLKKILRKGEDLTLNSEKRAKELVEKGFIKILSITKPETITKPDYEKTLKELRELYPDIKATSKKAFLEKL